ncbi:cytochrome b-c1 complex subunit 9 [Chiloscyllium plagiosum]|uniref:cytochrome b-c1 complex subunit 9 n=1 Tax=Chiloscyllium plagiosum TaxID=36176 RepID=UPI001CB81637|nr:cytochrome b-c1 complex subunit 9 [Chiloscyllium plagiosum]
MAVLRQIYNTMFKRTSAFVFTIVVGAVFFERVFDQAGDALFEQLNQGKLWKHIKHNYEKKEEE